MATGRTRTSRSTNTRWWRVTRKTGRQLLYVNRGFTSHIPQLARFESQTLLDMLYRHIETQPALTCRVRWTPNTLVFWDNRCTQHQAIWDYYPLDRSGHRVSIVGERPAALRGAAGLGGQGCSIPLSPPLGGVRPKAREGGRSRLRRRSVPQPPPPLSGSPSPKGQGNRI